MNIFTRSLFIHMPLLGFFITMGVVCDIPDVYARHSGPSPMTPDIPAEFGTYEPTKQLSGYLTIAVRDDTHDFVAALVKAFHSWHPNLGTALLKSKNYEGSPTRSPLGGFLDRQAKPRLHNGKSRGFFGSTDIRLLALGKKLTSEEKSEFISRFGYRPLEIPIARDAVVFYVHYKNPVKGLTLDEIQALFSEYPIGQEPSAVRKWGEIGVNGAWKIAPVNLYLPQKNREIPTYSFLQEFVLSNGKFRTDAIEKTGSASVVLAVANDVNGLGGGDFGFQIPHVRVLPIAKKPKLPYVTPTIQTIMNGTYPLSHPIYLYVNKSPTDDLPSAVSEFLTFINTRTAQEVVVKEGRFPLKTSEVQRNQQILNFSPEGDKDEIQPSN